MPLDGRNCGRIISDDGFAGCGARTQSKLEWLVRIIGSKSRLLRTLDARYYMDPAVFEAERADLLARTWQFAGHASQIEKSGDYFAFEQASESLFCVKGRDRVIRTFYNVCQHRAHQLVSGEGSTRVVVCPYHAWTHELTGELRAAPNKKSVPGFDRSS